ncbi:hypothetical protein CPB85DRAFT_1434638 [Mucidula mucida]|nr:hypothetical protein CPB85DRAFT_1434638 [Mucidula mucida]
MSSLQPAAVAPVVPLIFAAPPPGLLPLSSVAVPPTGPQPRRLLERRSRDVNRAAQDRVSCVGKAFHNHHAHIEKEERKRVERISKERLKALKADDQEAYIPTNSRGLGSQFPFFLS